MIQQKVSIVMPCYNKIAYIAEMFNSIIAQTWDNIELILVNDGSTDGTREVISEFEKKFYRRGYEVIIIDQKNEGVCVAAKNGLKQVSGDFVCLIDADDILKTNYIREMVTALTIDQTLDYCVCNYQAYRYYGSQREFIKDTYQYRFPPELQAEMYLLGKISMQVWVYMLRTSYLKKCKIVDYFITDTRGSHEPSFIIPLLANKGKYVHINKPLYEFNIFEESHSKTSDFNKLVSHWNEYERLVCIMLDKMQKILTPQKRRKLRACIRWTKLNRQLSDNFPTSNLLDLYNQIYNERIDFVNCMLSIEKLNDETSFDKYEFLFKSLRRLLSTRIVGFGAKGIMGKHIIPILIGTRLEPTELWDINANNDEKTLFGLPLSLPAIETLRFSDLVLVFPVNKKAKREIASILFDCEVGAIIFIGDYIKNQSIEESLRCVRK